MAFDLFGFKVFSKSEADALIESANRPHYSYSGSDLKSFEFRFAQIPMSALYDYAYYSDVYRTILNVIPREIFRNGAEFKEKFKCKCTNPDCAIELQAKHDACPECGSSVRLPDRNQLKKGEKFVKCVNANNQHLHDVMRSISPDHEILDNAWILVLKKYYFSNDGKIAAAEVQEVIRGDPLFMRKIINRRGMIGYQENKLIKVCPEHREKPQDGERCSICRKFLYPAHAYSLGEKPMYYIAGEVLHTTKYTPTLFYGFPMALTVLTKIRTLLEMDNFLFQAYGGKKAPKGIAAIRTANVQSAVKFWDEFVLRVQKDPHAIHPLFVPAGVGEGGKIIEFIDFMRSLQEMQYGESKNELMNRIGALFGVSPIFQADLSTSGGLNNEGLQITVTTRAVETGQAIYNDIIFPFIFDQLGITDYKYVLRPPEERDEMAELQREAQKIMNAEAMQRMGFKVSRTPEGEFVFSQEIEEKQQPAATPEQLIQEKAKEFLERDDGSPEEPEKPEIS